MWDGSAMNRLLLKGIELRYVLAMQLAVHGPADIGELIKALDWHGFCVQAGRRRRCRMRCVGRSCMGGYAGSAGPIRPAACRAPPNTESISVSWPA
ncbi:hypothetical protein L841_1319 [Mycobacterium sp. MAC_080597_8934]|nr:hypothetical protein L841_1319 [Mycobacterium sp. MAC_080597_8934]